MNIKPNFIEVQNAYEKYTICKNIIEKLPKWFGIPQSNNEYCEGVKEYLFYKIIVSNDVIGFVSIKFNYETIAEIYVMGILCEYHRRGIGTYIIKHITSKLKKMGIKYLEVKTLDESRESGEYKQTRLFYKKVGFIPIDVLKNEWGKDNPCLIMIKKL